jgi:predicted NBD/HSP70 family sugar kinase
VARETALLQAVHRRPGLSRAEAATLLGLSTGAAAELMAKLAAAHLLSERSLAPTGSRGRPSRQLVPHPSGPLVLAAEITQTTWRMQVVQLGGDLLAQKQGEHDGGPGEVLAVMAGAGSALRRRFPGRVRGLGLSVPGTVLNAQTLDSVGLGWQDVDLRSIWPRGALVLADNDASLAALAEARRGGAIGAQLALYLRVEVGLGGALIERGRLLSGSRGVAGEFGHMPFGDPAVRCPCGAAGCWGTAVDGTALARLLGQPAPPDPVTYARRVIAATGEAERAAVRAVATALGRGIAGLVNGLDADLVTLGGLGADLLAAAPAALHAAYHDGLMTFRRAAPPPVVAAALGDDGPIAGAGEEAWSSLLTQLG